MPLKIMIFDVNSEKLVLRVGLWGYTSWDNILGPDKSYSMTSKIVYVIKKLLKLYI